MEAYGEVMYLAVVLVELRGCVRCMERVCYWSVLRGHVFSGRVNELRVCQTN